MTLEVAGTKEIGIAKLCAHLCLPLSLLRVFAYDIHAASNYSASYSHIM